MKKAIVLLITLFVLTACKNDKTTKTMEDVNNIDGPEKTAKQNDGLTLLKGEFVYYDGAAVIQTHANIYGVFINDKMKELNQLAEKYKKEPTDMVPVEIRGKITNKKDDKILWENKVEVIEILNVSEPNPENNKVVKLGQE
ncbi:hypothetical protein [Aestuariibaculum sediminum]|uniref:NlpE C-terminal OB domain-containing protein n=1 Tax=Aestuariibaculum sediminum TaxID=2770637 RepID=A0A8J6PYD0_9FLAO|nr:hypothetical protein [Aestuariibaculum sediminum]MBD0831022.1 hypothetical protein [Aestuariibaculum sediminum]